MRLGGLGLIRTSPYAVCFTLVTTITKQIPRSAIYPVLRHFFGFDAGYRGQKFEYCPSLCRCQCQEY